MRSHLIKFLPPDFLDEATRFAGRVAHMPAEIKATVGAILLQMVSDAAVLEAGLDEATDFATDEADLKAATEIRKEEAAVFAAAEKELTATIDMLQRPIAVLEKELGGASLMQAKSASSAFDCEPFGRASSLAMQARLAKRAICRLGQHELPPQGR